MQAKPDKASRTGEPGATRVSAVPTQGLRQLAWVGIPPPPGAATLATCWHELLASWNPLPAGLELYVPEHSAPVHHPASGFRTQGARC